MTSITSAIAKIKDDSQLLFDEQMILKGCRDAGYPDSIGSGIESSIR